MGREAQVLCTIGHHTETVKALLESQERVLRGADLQQLQTDALHIVAERFSATRYARP